MKMACPKCGSTDVAIARDMLATRTCGGCGNTWLPSQDVSTITREDMAYALRVAVKRKFTRDYTPEDEELGRLAKKWGVEQEVYGWKEKDQGTLFDLRIVPQGGADFEITGVRFPGCVTPEDVRRWLNDSKPWVSLKGNLINQTNIFGIKIKEAENDGTTTE